MPADHGGRVAAAFALHRHSRWPRVRAAFIADNPCCAACPPESVADRLEVHHIVPFHICHLIDRPELELDPRNLVTLCGTGDDHHLLLGHLDDFSSMNPDLAEALRRFAGKRAAELRCEPDWVRAVKHRPADWNVMTDDQRDALRERVGRLFPR